MLFGGGAFQARETGSARPKGESVIGTSEEENWGFKGKSNNHRNLVVRNKVGGFDRGKITEGGLGHSKALAFILSGKTTHWRVPSRGTGQPLVGNS